MCFCPHAMWFLRCSCSFIHTWCSTHKHPSSSPLFFFQCNNMMCSRLSAQTKTFVSPLKSDWMNQPNVFPPPSNTQSQVMTSGGSSSWWRPRLSGSHRGTTVVVFISEILFILLIFVFPVRHPDWSTSLRVWRYPEYFPVEITHHMMRHRSQTYMKGAECCCKTWQWSFNKLCFSTLTMCLLKREWE